jgi:Xaa-Pro aminopeptidase
MISLNEHEKEIVILALTKVLEIEHSYVRVDEYKKVLDRLRAHENQEELEHIHLLHEIDEY